MSWYLFEVDDQARSLFMPLRTKSEWYEVMGQLNVGAANDATCGLLSETWPLWVEATSNAPKPLNYLFRGEFHALGGADPDVGFIGADNVARLAEALQAPDTYFLGLLEATSFGATSSLGSCKNELLILPVLRNFYATAASKRKAAIVLMD